ncbi:MAG: 2-dehydropantoate 2-reductase [Romboutsia sp.]|nr:2-dehydropantoate 2-reductase [Romboutsia sp.]
MNIAIIGVGGVGGYFGGKISRLVDNKNINVYFIARGKHLEEIKKNGLKLKTSDMGEFICKPTLATDNICDLPNLDVCFICVKEYDLNKVLDQLKDKISENTQIIPLLNGVDIYKRIRKIIKNGVVFPACVYVGTHIEKPGVVIQNGGSCTIIFGEDPKNRNSDPSAICEIMKVGEINFKWTERNIEEIWSKFMFIAAYGLVTAAEDKTLGEVFENKELSQKVLGIMNEIFEISKAENVQLEDDIVERSYRKADNFSYDTKTSFQRDYEIEGKPNEKEIFGQAIIDLGTIHNISTPITKSIYLKLE